MSRTNDAYARFAEYYDLEYDRYEDDFDLYRQFATEANGPVLELGCGSGRVLRSLEELGLPLAGIDPSPAMLARARRRLSSSTALVEASMEDLKPGLLPVPKYWLAFCAINTFLHLADADAQIAALQAVRSIVIDGGLLLLDLMAPDPHYLSSLDGRVLLEFSGTLSDGRRLDKWVTRTHDFASQTITTTVLFDTVEPGSGALTRVVDEYATRYIYRWELEHLLHRAGWEMIGLYGSYDLEPYRSESERMIALATWNDGPLTPG
ncbi:MAG TPA: class I SAM-dependent methyltransferase [Thermomicrobiales bacterium]|nr:class I SAM-dependent methyltransferase [Chloroflexota bacterium]HQZ89613.1 class I SAM-dependent methyltransferase [Thermomicrobiales bacterium]HRA32075.1 class I SAM-dependent methyltransferase [Thermomicrobiales bacterium]